MTLHGRYSNGKVILDDPGSLRNGDLVEVRRAPRARPKRKKTSKRAKRSPNPPPSLIERLGKFVASFDGPRDLSAQHDHYAHGRPKRR
jgi:hypothetical protein